MNLNPTEPTTVIALAERYGWPRAQLAPAVSVGRGEATWRHFGVKASPERLAQAHAALKAMPENPPATITAGLV